MIKLLTVVVPVYKVEKYINKCLDSLIVRDELMNKLEVIIVNDGTPDNSAVMAKEYEKRYPDTFQVLDKENGGHGSAWNKGLELATGKYLRFLDSDDWLTNLSDFMDRLEKFDVDMVFTDLEIVYEDGKFHKRKYRGTMESNKQYNVYGFDWRTTNKMWSGHNIANFHMCTYRTEMLKRHHPIFFEKIFYDDEILMVLPLCSSKTFVYFDLTLYNYLRGREGQTMDPKTMLRNIDFYIKIRKYMVEFYHTHPVVDKSLDQKLHYILEKKMMETFKLISQLSYDESISKSRELNSWIKDNYPEMDGGWSYSLYNSSSKLYYFIYHYVYTFLANIKHTLFRR